MSIHLLNQQGDKKKVNAFIQIVLDENEKVTVSTSSKNPITNMGLLSIAEKMMSVGKINTQEQNNGAECR